MERKRLIYERSKQKFKEGLTLPLWKKNLYILWVGTVIGGVAFSLVSPFLPMLLEEVGATSNIEMLSGLAFSVTFVTSAFMGPVWGTLADKYGRKQQILRAGFGIAVVYIAMSFSTSPTHIILSRLLLGFFNGFIPSAIAMVATNTPEHELGYALGIINTGYSFGSIAGPLVGGYMSSFFGMRRTLVIAGGVLLFATFIVLIGTKEEVESDKTIEFHIIRDIKLCFSYKILLSMFLIMAIYNLSLNIIQPILPLMVKKLALDANADPAVMTGIIFSVAGFATVIGAPRWGKYGQREGFSKAMAIGMAGGAVTSFLMAISFSVTYLGIMRFLFGLFLAAVGPSATAVLARKVPNSYRSRVLSINSSVSQLGGAAGPMIGGAVASYFNYNAVFILTGIGLALLTFWVRTLDTDSDEVLSFTNC